jgi:hypothetical protein
MATRRLVEKRTRGVFGWFFMLLFWGWNALMLWALVAGAGATNCAKYATAAERTGCQAGTGMGVMMILTMWAVGSVVFGMLAYFSRGRRELIEHIE